jgi:hypothetical protein
MYKPPIIKPKLSKNQQAMLNLIRFVKGENVPLKQAAKEFYEYRYPKGVQQHVCDQMRAKAACHKGNVDSAGNLKKEYFLHCIGSTDYVVLSWDCKKVRKQITKWNGITAFTPTGEYEEYYSLYLEGYWLFPPKADKILYIYENAKNEKCYWQKRIPNNLNMRFIFETCTEFEFNHFIKTSIKDNSKPILVNKYKVEPSGQKQHPFKVIYKGNPFLYELEKHAEDFCKILNSKTTLPPKQR